MCLRKKIINKPLIHKRIPRINVSKIHSLSCQSVLIEKTINEMPNVKVRAPNIFRFSASFTFLHMKNINGFIHKRADKDKKKKK